MLETLETAYGPTHAVDIQSYVEWREAIAAGPVIPVAVAFSLASPLIGGEIIFDAKPTSTYIVLHSFNLCNWQEILRVKSQSGPTAVPIRSITRKASGESRASTSLKSYGPPAS